MNVNKIEIISNQKDEQKFYQWDTDRKVKIVTDEHTMVDEVHFSNVFSKEAIIVAPKADAEIGGITARVPDELLQFFMPIRVYVVMKSENGERTVFEQEFDVTQRPKPADYIYTETDLKTYQKLEQKINDLEAESKNYLTKETDPTVPDWAKQPTKPNYTAEEVGAMPDTTEIPRKISDLEDDSNFVSKETLDEDLQGYVKDTDYATKNKGGVVKVVDYRFGLLMQNGTIMTAPATTSNIDARNEELKPITTRNLDYAVKKALSDCKLQEENAWTDEEKKSARELIGALERKSKTTGYTGVYAFDEKGNDAIAYYTKKPTPKSLAQRNDDGSLSIGEPVNDNEATTKKYVDDSIANYEQLELINEVEISEEITALSISEDMNGEPFELREAILFGYFPKYEGETKIPDYYFCMLNNKIYGDCHNRSAMYTGLIIPDKKNSVSWFWRTKIDLKNKIRTEEMSSQVNYGGFIDLYPAYNEKVRKMYQLNDKIGTITSIGFAGGLAFKGCKFILYGVRA